MGSVITAVRTAPITAQLQRSWGETVPTNHVIAVSLQTDDGRVGHGFTWTPTIGGRAARALIDDDLAPFLIGRPAHPAAIWDAAWEHLHEAGSGLVQVALAGVDLALWDLRACAAGESLADHLGRRHDHVRAYGSGVNLHYSLEQLVAQAERWVDNGFTAAKVKVGKPDLAEDVERIAAVRKVLGPDRALMIDANQRWDLPTARRAIEALAPFDLAWMEEPLRADAVHGYEQLRRFSPVPLAMGENLHTIHRFADVIERGAIDIAQPNIVRVGGITPFLRIAELARAHGVTVAPHLLPELSGQVALSLAGPSPVEVVEGADFSDMGILNGESPIRVADGLLRQTGIPGIGVSLRVPASLP